MVISGGLSGTNFLTDTWLFDAASRTWTQLALDSPTASVVGTILVVPPPTLQTAANGATAWLAGGFGAAGPFNVVAFLAEVFCV